MSAANGEYHSLNDAQEDPTVDAVEKLTVKSVGGSSLDSLTRHFRNTLDSFKQLRPLQIVAILSLVLINVFSGSGQLLSLNMVVRAYLKGPANLNIPFTIVTLTSILTAVITTVIFVGYVIVKRPRLRFLLTCKNLYLSLGMGFTVALNGVMVVSATANVPEILQAFLLSTTIIWTFLFVKVMFGEKRSYFSPLVALSFVLSLGGVLVGSASKFSTSGMSTDTVYWTLFFAAGLIPGALNGVVSAKYMRSFTLTDEQLALVENRVSKRTLAENDYLLARGRNQTIPMPNFGSDVPPLVGTDANTAKFACLTLGSISQVVCMFALLPTSAIPWIFQSSPSLSALGDGLLSGYECTFNKAPGCSDATIYFMIFLACFIGNSVSSMWLNYYSPAVCAIIGELNAPIAAVALIAIPALNVNHKAYNVGEAIGAVILITLGSTIYTIWEESTRHTGGGDEVIRSSRRFLSAPAADGEVVPAQTCTV